MYKEKAYYERMLVQNGKNKGGSVPNCIIERNQVQTFESFIVNITKCSTLIFFLTFGQSWLFKYDVRLVKYSCILFDVV